jgi:hypothetical protein
VEVAEDAVPLVSVDAPVLAVELSVVVVVLALLSVLGAAAEVAEVSEL